MDVAFFGRGPVAERCRAVLDDLGIAIVEQADLWISVHWPKLFKPPFPAEGILNLHNSLLPWNRGAHACTWAIVDNTPHGATMHWVDEGIDTGPIFHCEQMDILADDTTDSLYKRTADLEVKVFRDSMKMLLNGDRTRIPQPVGTGSFHRKADFRRLVRALTTSDCMVTYEA